MNKKEFIFYYNKEKVCNIFEKSDSEVVKKTLPKLKKCRFGIFGGRNTCIEIELLEFLKKKL